MKKKKVIIIDDCKLTLSIARDLMEEAGFEAETADELQRLKGLSGADGYVTKPLSKGALLAEVRRLT